MLMTEIMDFERENKIIDGRYQLIRPLSTDGGTADVWLALDTNTIDSSFDSEESAERDTGMLVAIKIYRPKNALDIDGEKRFREEFKIVYECRHENLLQPTGFSIYNGIPYLVLPYCKKGSSEQLIGKRLSSDNIWKFILDVSSGLNRLHTNETPIIHQDIKPANVLIDNNGDYAITDFGISSKRGGEHGLYYDDENSGTMAYMAPERFQEDAVPMPQSDIWAFGATLHEILSGRVPFGEEGGKYQLLHPNPIPSIANVPSDIQRLISDCLAIEPGNRPSAQEIKEAALSKHYPVKSRRKYNWMVGFAIAVAAIVMVILSFYKPAPPLPTNPTNKELYEIALKDISSDNESRFNRGKELMDSLSGIKYIPAMYQMAYTYGWYKEDESLRRKKMLDIDVFEKKDRRRLEDSEIELYLPKDDRYTKETMTLLLRILALNDSAYAKINGQAAYRLVCYYMNPNNIEKFDEEKGRKYLEESKKWAEISNDSVLLHNIDESNKTINKNNKVINEFNKLQKK